MVVTLIDLAVGNEEGPHVGEVAGSDLGYLLHFSILVLPSLG